jgi:apolipoprotein N-acyltransferase
LQKFFIANALKLAYFIVMLLNLLAILAGAQLALAFAPYNLYPLAILSPALLLALWTYATPRRALLYGFLYGLGLFGIGASWVYVSIHTYGNAAAPVAAVITLLFIIILAMFIAGQGYLFSKICLNAPGFPACAGNDKVKSGNDGKQLHLWKYLLGFPVIWVLFEWLRSWVFTGFPWLFLGYTQINAPLAGLAPIFGVYGVSFAVALTSAIFIVPFVIRKAVPIFMAFLILIIVWVGAGLLTYIKWTVPQGKAIRVSLIQGNIPQEIKWQAKQLPVILARYQNLTKKHWNSKLIVWPEAAIPVFESEVQPFLKKLNKSAKRHNSTVITGIITQGLDGKYYNAMLAVGKNQSVYLKRHLVPFGEYTPWPVITNFIAALMDIPMSDFSPGSQKQPDFIAANTVIAPSICYEIAYPTKILSFLPKAKILVNISDDSWFGKSAASAQQLQIAQMRSLETGRYQLVSTNTGLTAIIKPNGKIQAQAPAFKKFVLTGKIWKMTGATLWVKLVNYF